MRITALVAPLSQKMAGGIAGRVGFRFSLQLWGILCQNRINERGKPQAQCVCSPGSFLFFVLGFFLYLSCLNPSDFN